MSKMMNVIIIGTAEQVSEATQSLDDIHIIEHFEVTEMVPCRADCILTIREGEEKVADSILSTIIEDEVGATIIK